MCKLGLASIITVYTGPTASAEKASLIFRGTVILFRWSLMEVQILIKHLHGLDETYLNRLPSLT